MKIKVKRIHLTAVAILIGYYAISKTIFFSTVVSPNPLIYLLVPYIFGSVAAVMFLYIFSHDDFFAFAKEIEKKNMKKEKKLLKRFGHHGKLASTALIAIFGGPVFAALTTRMMLHNFKHKYYFVVAANIPATLWAMGSAKGVFSLFF